MKKVKYLYSIFFIVCCLSFILPFVGCKKYNVVEKWEFTSLYEINPELFEEPTEEILRKNFLAITFNSDVDIIHHIVIYNSDFDTFKCETLKELLNNERFIEFHNPTNTPINSDKKAYIGYQSDMRYLLFYDPNIPKNLLNYIGCIEI